ncbi:uncharacterized protein TNCT_336481 [Trichonephila clavata]|uniref:RRM domain-containing protein n=1 Tax=Trichonephila clavata TaxID=2740835 RepID=A0A8X6KMI9_TRICU|nr:uncharacterized protein TNCT_336481 [Trichonephila clavata]
MSFFSCIWNRSSERVVTMMIDMKEAITVTQFLLKMFREINICHKPEFPLNTPPKKKRKLQLSTSPETEQNQPNSEEVTNDETPEDVYFPEAKSKKRKDRKKKFLRDPPTTLPKNERNSVINIRVSRSFKKRPKYKKEQNIIPILQQIEVSNPIKSARCLCKLFRGCINFVQTSRLTPIEDIDLILKSIVQYGKVMQIQDHWSKSDVFKKSSNQWNGALVTYRYIEDSRKALDGLLFHGYPNVLPVNMSQHLLTIGELEYRLTFRNTDSFGSSILIEGFSSKMSRDRLHQEVEQYGEIRSCQWKSNKDKSPSYEVTYEFIVEAVAAALALDGKVVGRNVLKTRLLMRRREMNLHMMVCGYYC